MNPDEIVRTLKEQYGISSMEELDQKIRGMALDITMFCKAKEEKTA